MEAREHPVERYGAAVMQMIRESLLAGVVTAVVCSAAVLMAAASNGTPGFPPFMSTMVAAMTVIAMVDAAVRNRPGKPLDRRL